MNNLIFPSIDSRAEAECNARLNFLAKVPGSLGVLEKLAIKLAGITRSATPCFPNKTVVLFASDHGIARHGLSSTGQDVTERQVRNFLKGGGTINAFCRNAGATLSIVDVGIMNDLYPLDGLIACKVMPGARDFSIGPAMSKVEAEKCFAVGLAQARKEAEKGADMLAAGEMGIGNTSPASALVAVMTGYPVSLVTGAGSGIDINTLQKKIKLIEEGIRLNQPDPADPWDVLAKVGGPEIAAMSGLMAGAASMGIPCVVDGFIAAAAALIATGIYPEVLPFLIGSHISVEPGHNLLMKHLGIETYFDFGLRLGEGTGAALFFPIIDASVRILSEMSTMRDIGLSD